MRGLTASRANVFAVVLVQACCHSMQMAQTEWALVFVLQENSGHNTHCVGDDEGLHNPPTLTPFSVERQNISTQLHHACERLLGYYDINHN